MKILVTGAAGFIGAAVSQYLINRGDQVVGIDNINDYYDVNLKHARLDEIKSSTAADLFSFIEMGVEERDKMAALFEEHKFDRVVHLAAQAGVRYSLENPNAYVDSNIVGFVNILEGCRHNKVEHLVYASSSSVYGANEAMPFTETERADTQLTIYAATKKANESMAHSYAHLWDLPTTMFRFFTVYGPWGRPDLAYYKFVDAILDGRPIDIYNHGDMYRDFTYVDDIVDGIEKCLRKNFKNKIFNLGNHRSESLMNMVALIEEGLGKKAKINFMDMQPGDVQKTHAGIKYSRQKLNYNPKTNIKDGIPKFLEWFKYYKKNYS